LKAGVEDKWLRLAQPNGVTRRIFFDLFLSFDSPTPWFRSSRAGEVRASIAQMVSKTVLYAKMPETNRRRKLSRALFYPLARPRTIAYLPRYASFWRVMKKEAMR